MCARGFGKEACVNSRGPQKGGDLPLGFPFRGGNGTRNKATSGLLPRRSLRPVPQALFLWNPATFIAGAPASPLELRPQAEGWFVAQAACAFVYLFAGD